MKLLLAFSLLAATSAVCPNDCSLHGSCGLNDKCSCHSNSLGEP
eukprot:CAMPEP_0185815432 /NCGR_PEP_ID=MMETSP1322-20130828/15760_1 /TAXON_ID=265543 /ORGANISM="Minutocellus polymorphus, Strain RCC2270" /LENGTH=43 /DNA_ID= /DNA_START= /DNA_END= /DNA_ORIENTATION=